MSEYIENIIKQLENRFSDTFTGEYIGARGVSKIDNSVRNLFYIRNKNKDTAEIEIRGLLKSVKKYELIIVVQYDEKYSTTDIESICLDVINPDGSNRTQKILVNYDAIDIVKEETGIPLKTDMKLFKMTFSHKEYIKTNCDICLNTSDCL